MRPDYRAFRGNPSVNKKDYKRTCVHCDEEQESPEHLTANLCKSCHNGLLTMKPLYGREGME